MGKRLQTFYCIMFLVPGAFGAGTSSIFLKSEDYFSEYRSYFEAKGCKTKTAIFTPDATIEQRGLLLKDQYGRFLKASGADSGVIVAHSQGGMDARFALKTLGLQGVQALVTIGTPHHGTPVADFAVEHRNRGSVLYWFLRLVGRYDLRALPFAGEMRASFLEAKSKYFEAVPAVHYASGVGLCQTHCGYSLRFLSWLVGESPGDGIIPADSQRFGDDLGEYDLDHISEIGADAEKRTERLRFLDKIWEYIGKIPPAGGLPSSP